MMELKKSRGKKWSADDDAVLHVGSYQSNTKYFTYAVSQVAQVAVFFRENLLV